MSSQVPSSTSGSGTSSVVLLTVNEEWVTEIREYDVLTGRGTRIDNNPGNIAFREIVRKRQPEYTSTNRQHRKQEIAEEIILQVFERGGRFLQQVVTVVTPEPAPHPPSEGNEQVPSSVPPDGIDLWKKCDREIILRKVKQILRSYQISGMRKAASLLQQEDEEEAAIKIEEKDTTPPPTPPTRTRFENNFPADDVHSHTAANAHSVTTSTEYNISDTQVVDRLLQNECDKNSRLFRQMLHLQQIQDLACNSSSSSSSHHRPRPRIYSQDLTPTSRLLLSAQYPDSTMNLLGIESLIHNTGNVSSGATRTSASLAVGIERVHKQLRNDVQGFVESVSMNQNRLRQQMQLLQVQQIQDLTRCNGISNHHPVLYAPDSMSQFMSIRNNNQYNNIVPSSHVLLSQKQLRPWYPDSLHLNATSLLSATSPFAIPQRQSSCPSSSLPSNERMMMNMIAAQILSESNNVAAVPLNPSLSWPLTNQILPPTPMSTAVACSTSEAGSGSLTSILLPTNNNNHVRLQESRFVKAKENLPMLFPPTCRTSRKGVRVTSTTGQGSERNSLKKRKQVPIDTRCGSSSKTDYDYDSTSATDDPSSLSSPKAARVGAGTACIAKKKKTIKK